MGRRGPTAGLASASPLAGRPAVQLRRTELLQEVRAWRAAAAAAGAATPEELQVHLVELHEELDAAREELGVVRRAWEAGARALARWNART